eukprot:scaffold2623_cov250-Pinguiococcus_pyrenoidosus.AAC.2
MAGAQVEIPAEISLKTPAIACFPPASEALMGAAEDVSPAAKRPRLTHGAETPHSAAAPQGHKAKSDVLGSSAALSEAERRMPKGVVTATHFDVPPQKSPDDTLAGALEQGKLGAKKLVRQGKTGERSFDAGLLRELLEVLTELHEKGDEAAPRGPLDEQVLARDCSQWALAGTSGPSTSLPLPGLRPTGKLGQPVPIGRNLQFQRELRRKRNQKTAAIANRQLHHQEETRWLEHVNETKGMRERLAIAKDRAAEVAFVTLAHQIMFVRHGMRALWDYVVRPFDIWHTRALSLFVKGVDARLLAALSPGALVKFVCVDTLKLLKLPRRSSICREVCKRLVDQAKCLQVSTVTFVIRHRGRTAVRRKFERQILAAKLARTQEASGARNLLASREDSDPKTWRDAAETREKRGTVVHFANEDAAGSCAPDLGHGTEEEEEEEKKSD